jgi:transaldolase
MNHLEQLNVKIFADGADRAGMLGLYANPLIKGLTTNPTLMRKAGVSDYEAFCLDILETVKSKPISFEVFSDDFDEMYDQALKINSWQENVFVKIPITNTKGQSSIPLVTQLSAKKVQLNVTAILTEEQVKAVAESLDPDVRAVVSIFAGRIADTGVDPVPLMRRSRRILDQLPNAELLWASVREVLNIFQADQAGCSIVTVPHDILDKAARLCGVDLAVLSLETVKMFREDAVAAGFQIRLP